MYLETKKCVACFIVIFALMWYSGTELTVSPGYACGSKKKKIEIKDGRWVDAM